MEFGSLEQAKDRLGQLLLGVNIDDTFAAAFVAPAGFQGIASAGWAWTKLGHSSDSHMGMRLRGYEPAMSFYEPAGLGLEEGAELVGFRNVAQVLRPDSRVILDARVVRLNLAAQAFLYPGKQLPRHQHTVGGDGAAVPC
ncbi:hypothetical protein A9979_08215 [Pseudomonas sp. UMC76]|nr:hypothetical protein [Pseudomonas sp. UMC76]